MSKFKHVGYFLLGAGVGMLTASIFYEREMNKPIGPTEKYISKTSEKKANKTGLDEIIQDEPETNGTSEIIDMARNRVERRRPDTQRIQYSKKFSEKTILENSPSVVSPPVNPIEEDIDLEMFEDSPSDDIPDEEPDYVLERVEEYMEVYLDENPIDFVSLVYYQGDETLCDDREQLISNPEDVVGMVALERLVEGGPGAESGVIFVRNLKTMINYEVVLDLGKYSETVLGIFEEKLRRGSDGDVDI